MLSAIQKTFITSGVTDHHAPTSSHDFKNPLLGVNVKTGYQNDSSNVVGLA